MAKSISIKSKAEPAPVAPPATPPQQNQAPGITMKGPPLPAGKMFSAPSGMTQLEFNKLTEVGWQPGQTITNEMREAILAMQEDAQQSGPLPVSPDTPPVVLNKQDISQLPPDQQGKYNQILNEAVTQAAAAQPPPAPTSEVAKKIAESKTLNIQFGEPERPAQSHIPNTVQASNPKAKQQQAQSAVRTEEPLAPMTDCPHCGWVLNQPDIPEPSYVDKQNFLQTQILGDGKPYTREYKLLNGELVVTFRTISTREIDACYKQTDIDRTNGEIGSDYDRWERVNRYRLYLQLQRLRSSKFDHEMPDGLSAWHAPNAEAVWEFPDDVSPDQRLKAIENYMMEQVIVSESINRIVQVECGRFNRLVSKLEAQVDNDSFWQATKAQSS